jgi:hypothetical protein
VKRDYEGLWRRRMQAFDGSGLSVTQFCDRERVSTATFYKWRERLAARKPRTGVEFVEVGASDRAVVEIVVNDAMVVRVRGDFDAAALNRVLDVVAARR